MIALCMSVVFAADWVPVPGAHVALVDLPSAPYPVDGGAWTDASVLIAVPDGLSRRGPLDVVTHLHGFEGVVEELVPSFRLIEQHVASGVDAVLVVPQGPYRARSGDFGKLMRPGGHAALVADVAREVRQGGFVDDVGVGLQVVTVHSGGYRCAARLIEQGGLPIHAVHLFDALYGDVEVFAGFVRGGGRLVSLHTPGGRTGGNNATLRAQIEGEGSSLDDATLASRAAIVAASDLSHGGCLYERRDYERWLRFSGLPLRR